jgi:hypothetical protein
MDLGLMAIVLRPPGIPGLSTSDSPGGRGNLRGHYRDFGSLTGEEGCGAGRGEEEGGNGLLHLGSSV